MKEQEYAIEITSNNRFEILENMDDDNSDNNINKKWKNIKTIIKEIKQQLIEKNESTETLKNEECKIAIEEMKKAREEWLMQGRRKSRSMSIKEKKHTK